MIAVNLRGLGNIQRRFKRMPPQLRQKISQTIRQTAITKIETVAKNKLTSDKHVDTGRLRASIHTEYKGTRRILPGKISDELGCLVGTNVEYAKYVERLDSYLIYAYKKARPVLIKRVREAIGDVLK